jgi:septum formation protein
VGEEPGRIDGMDEHVREALERPLVLASASPRRADLLTQVGIAYEVRVSDVAEEADEPGADPADVAETHARQKAQDVAGGAPGRLVLGADTVVVLDGRVLGKPADEADARGMLRALSGRAHEVITGVALALDAGGGPVLLAQAHVRTRVVFRELSDAEIEAYVASREPMDKAGGYGIQGRGALLVHEIEGCYFNVVGLPLSRTWALLSALGHEVPRPRS